MPASQEMIAAFYREGILALADKERRGWLPNNAPQKGWTSEDITDLTPSPRGLFILSFGPGLDYEVATWESLNIVEHQAVLLYLAKRL